MADPIYGLEPNLTAAEFRQVLVDSTLGERRPIDEPARLETMLRNASLVVTARIDGALVGIARSVTDFAFCCYLSDLAVSKSAQGRGIGRELIAQTRRHCGGKGVSVHLHAAPGAVSFYEAIGMPRNPDAFSYKRTR
jgi:GNAT superfamily N-acetyltransferase